MTAKQIEEILSKVANKKKNEQLKDNLLQLTDNIEIGSNFLGDQFWSCGQYSIGAAKIENRCTGKPTYSIKLFQWGNYEIESKQFIEKENYLQELENFMDLMITKMIAA